MALKTAVWLGKRRNCARPMDTLLARLKSSSDSTFGVAAFLAARAWAAAAPPGLAAGAERNMASRFLMSASFMSVIAWLDRGVAHTERCSFSCGSVFQCSLSVCTLVRRGPTTLAGGPPAPPAPAPPFPSGMSWRTTLPPRRPEPGPPSGEPTSWRIVVGVPNALTNDAMSASPTPSLSIFSRTAGSGTPKPFILTYLANLGSFDTELRTAAAFCAGVIAFGDLTPGDACTGERLSCAGALPI
mmetsp:Transcript_24954/g.86941  ORF Transcript_24954/g.86941 Transcript_24954/m.86941 type:complete len:243 (-) Transcript_24954:1373-2101(-)